MTPVPTDAPTPSLLPSDFSILPAFTPAFPCALENVTANDENLCRHERVQETIIGESEQRVLIRRDYHVGQGCWSSINVDTHELKVRDRRIHYPDSPSGVFHRSIDGQEMARVQYL